MLPLKDFRTTAKGLPDLLPYGVLVEPDIVLCKDGSLLGAWVIYGEDMASCTPDELDYVSSQVSRSFSSLGSGWTVHVDALRRPEVAYPSRESSHFPDPVTTLIEEERRQLFEGGSYYSTETVLTLVYKPHEGQTKLLRAAAQQKAQVNDLEVALDTFHNAANAFQDLAISALTLKRLTSSEAENGAIYSDLLSFLHECITGEHRRVALPHTPAYLDCLIGGVDFVAGVAPRIDSQHLAVLALDGIPAQSWPCMMGVLDLVPFPLRYSTRFICLDKQEAQKEIDRYRKTWRQKMFRFWDMLFPKASPRLNRDAARMAEDSEEAYAAVEGDELSMGFYTASIVMWDADPAKLEERCRMVRKLVTNVGFGCRIESLNAVEAWLGTHPGNWWANVRRPLITSLNLADFLPLSTIWTGHANNPCPFYPPQSPPLLHCASDGVSPFRLNVHVGDVGHTLIFGPTGAGKSTLLATLAAQFRRYERASVFAFDKGLSLYPLCKAVGGAHHDIGKSGNGFAPLQEIDSHEDQAWAEDWLEKLCILQGVEVLPVHRNAIHIALQSVVSNPREMRSLTDFFNVVQHEDVKSAIKHYTTQGSMGLLLDASEDGLTVESFMVFELEELMSLGEKNVLPVLLYLFRRIEKALKGQPCMLILDEAWLMLGHPVFREKIREWLKVMRRANCAVIIATQSLSDSARSGILDVLIESCHTTIFLPNTKAREVDPAELYKRFGLNPRQIEIIATATPKREYYVTSPEGRRLVSLALGPVALSFVGVSDRGRLAKLRDLEAEYGAGWPIEWLRINNISVETEDD